MVSKLTALVLLGLALLAGTAYANQVPVPNADTERAVAVEAEKNGDFDAALLHYETILDSTKTDQLTRRELRTKIAELKSRVAPNTDPSKAGVWKCKAFVIRTLDFKWTDKNGKEHHVVNKFTDEEIAKLRVEMAGFQDLVWKYTWGNLRIEWDLEVLESTLDNLFYEEGLDYCGFCMVTMPLVKDRLKYGEADTVMVYVNMWGDKDNKEDDVPCGFWADCWGVQPSTKGATYIVFNCGGGLVADPPGELQLHEWLHAVDMSMGWAHNFPAEGPMDWTSDGCDHEVASGCYKPADGEIGWMPIYLHQMRDHATRRMWRTSPIFSKSDNVWLNDYIRDWKVLGPFSGKGMEHSGINHAFINEKKPLKSDGWKTTSAPGKYPNFAAVMGGVTDKDQVCYGAFAIESDKEQVAVIRTQRFGGCKIWQDGKLIFDSPWDRNWDTDPNVIDVRLKAGKNVFLVKLNNFACDWAFNLKVTGLLNETLKDVKFVLP